ncbi:MAG TPA: ubiquitin-like protein UBact [Armatimonadota bacterium]
MAVQFEERRVLPGPEPARKLGDGGGGPGRPDVKRPDTRRLMERMKRVDPDQAKRYRQRSGE